MQPATPRPAATPDARVTRARSFSAVADAYDAARPSYPIEALPWLVGDRPALVVDVAAGTGKLSAVLAAAGHRVVAVEPSVEMLQQLVRAVPGVAAVAGTAEAIPLVAAVADAVTVAQAYHWFRPLPALDELARVLHPGGVLCLVWNERVPDTPWVDAVWAHLGGATGTALLRDDWERDVEEHPAFGPLALRKFRHVQQLDRTTLLALVRSRSTVAVMTDDERAGVLERVLATVDAHPDTRGRELLELPYVTRAYRVARVDPEAGARGPGP